MLIKFFSGLCLLLAVTSASAENLDRNFSHQRWDDLLKRHVVVINQGQANQVNYTGLLADRKKLKRYLMHLESVSKETFDLWSKNQQLAFLINAYNAWTVEFILTRYPDIESIKDLGSLFRSPWSKAFIPLLGQQRSLDNIEHDLIRGAGRYSEPRIHFAVNCASVGCPSLRAEAYRASALEQQLDDATRLFLQDRSRNRFVNGTLEVSSIFKWYREDFDKPWRDIDSLQQFFTLYASALDIDIEGDKQKTLSLLDNVKLTFIDYDWRLNDAASKKYE